MQDGHRGTLSKRTGFFGSFKPFTYIKNDMFLVEYKAGSNPSSAQPLNMFDIRNSFVEEASTITGHRESFIIHLANGKSLFLLASSIEDKKIWMELLTRAVNESNGKRSAPADMSRSSTDISSVNSASGNSNGNGNKFGTIQGRPEHLHDGDSDRASTHSGQVSTHEDVPILNFLESFTDAVIIGDQNGLIFATNSAADRLFGFAAGVAKGQPLYVLMPEPYKSQHDAYIFRHQKFGTEKLLGKTRKLMGERQNKETFPIQVSLGKLPSGNMFLATIREITKDEEKKPAKAAKHAAAAAVAASHTDTPTVSDLSMDA